MRIVALVTGPEALADAARLAGEIRSFNAGVDFRLRFLHVEIETLFGAGARAAAELVRRVDWARPFPVREEDPLRAAAGLSGGRACHDNKPAAGRRKFAGRPAPLVRPPTRSPAVAGGRTRSGSRPGRTS